MTDDDATGDSPVDPPRDESDVSFDSPTVEVTRRDLLAGTGAIGVAGLLGSAVADMDDGTTADTTPDPRRYRWSAGYTDHLFRKYDDQGNADPPLAFTESTTIQYLGVNWTNWVNPSDQVDGGAWKHTFALSTNAAGLKRVKNDSEQYAGPDEYWVPAINPNDGPVDEAEFETKNLGVLSQYDRSFDDVYDYYTDVDMNFGQTIPVTTGLEVESDTDSTAVSARRHPEQYSFVNPAWMIGEFYGPRDYAPDDSAADPADSVTKRRTKLHAKRPSQRDSDVLTSPAQNPSRLREILVEEREEELNEDRNAEALLSLAITGASIAAPATIPVALASIAVTTVMMPWYKRELRADNPDDPTEEVQYQNGFSRDYPLDVTDDDVESKAVGGHYVLFDAYVPAGNSGKFSVKSKYSYQMLSEQPTEENATWEIEIPPIPHPDELDGDARGGYDPDPSEVPSVSPDGKTNVTADPTPAINCRAEEVTLEYDLVFDAYDTVLGGAPIERYSWEAYVADDQSSPSVQAEPGAPPDDPRFTGSGPTFDPKFQRSDLEDSDGEVGARRFTFQLEVEDENGNTKRRRQNYLVKPCSVEGEISIEPDPAIVGKELTVDATITDDTTVERHRWNVSEPDAGVERDGPPTAYTFEPSSMGPRTITLEVEGTDCADELTRDIDVKNQKPEVQFSADETDITSTQEVTFDASATTDPEEHSLIGYDWTFRGPVDAVVDEETWTRSGETVTTTFNPAVEAPDDGASTGSATDAETSDTEQQFEVELEVTDEYYATGEATKQYDVVTDNTAPDTEFDWTPETPEVEETVSFDASATSDEDDVEYQWDFGTTGEWTDPSPSPTIDYTFNTYGEFDVALRATDEYDQSQELIQTVTVNDQPLPDFDVRNAEGDESELHPDEELVFDASPSTDIDGQITDYQWEFGDGATGTDEQTTHTYDSTGDYEVTLTVTDDAGSESEATETISLVSNAGPTVSIDPETTTPEPNQTIDLTANASDDDGEIVDYQWSVSDANTKTVEASFSEATTVSVTVTDDDGATADDQLEITPNSLPDPDLTFETPVIRNESVTFDASATNDPEGNEIEYEWQFTEGGEWTAPSPSPTAEHTYYSVGTKVVTLRVSDLNDDAVTLSDQFKVTDAPQPAFSYTNQDGSDSSIDQNETLQFDASASSDRDGTVESYDWAFGDGATATKKKPTHAYSSPGSFDVTLTTTDNDGATDSVTETVPVPENEAPNVTEITHSADPTAKSSVSFSATASDPDGDAIVQYYWDWGDGSSSDLTYDSSKSHTFDSPGTYEVTVTAEDGEGAQGDRTKSVTVDERRIDPKVDVVSSPSSLTAGETGSFDTHINDPDNDGIDSVNWEWGDGDVSWGRSPSHSFDTPDTYYVTVTVTDNDGDTGPAQHKVIVDPKPQDPYVTLSVTDSAMVDDVVELTATDYGDPDGGSVDLQFQYGDGTSSPLSDVNPRSHTYSAPGDYSPTVTVVDDENADATDSESLTIEREATVEDVDGPTSDVAKGTEVTLTVNPSHPGEIVDYTWDDGTSGRTRKETRNVSVSQTFTCTVENEWGYEATGSIEVTWGNSGGGSPFP
jgi:PKD repeat protein